MKKTLSVILAALMIALTLVPAFASDGTIHNVTFIGPSSLFPSDAYSYVPSLNGSPVFEEADPGMFAIFSEEYRYIPLAYLQGDSYDRYSVAQKYVYDKSSKTYEEDENGTYINLGIDMLPITDLTDKGLDAFVGIFQNGDVTLYDEFGNEKMPGRFIPKGDTAILFSDLIFPDDKIEAWKMVIDGQMHFLRPSSYTVNAALPYEDGSVLTFFMMTNEKYDVATVNVFVNGELIEHNQRGEYAISVNRDLVITVAEFDANNSPILLRNHYTMTLTSGDGYSVKPLKNQNKKVVYYGDSFDFRVKLTKGYSGDAMKVMVVRGNNDLAAYLGDDLDFIYSLNIDGTTETLTSLGVDEDGYRIYRIENVTKDCKVIVSGVREQSKVGILATLKRILKLILDALGIHLDIFDDMMKAYDVSIDMSAAPGITCEVTSSGKTSGSVNSLSVLAGESVTLKLTKRSEAQNVTVSWTQGGKTTSDYDTVWTSHYNRYTGEYTCTATYYIDNINADTAIVITAN